MSTRATKCLFVVALLISTLALGAPANAQTAPPADLPPVVLERPLPGPAAIPALGPDLPAVAALNRMTAAELLDLLRSDRTVGVDRRGRVFFVDDPPPAPAPLAPQAAPFPFDQTFRLHSKPGSSRVVYVDFDGGTVSGTVWNESNGVATSQPPFDHDGTPTFFTIAELEIVQSVWQRVAEDFAPFDVDVTTEEPPTDALLRSTSSDTQYGTRVLVTPSPEARMEVCGNVCGGFAYIGIFNEVETNTYYQPAWVFSQVYFGNPKNLAEAVSHEAGHNLGLFHDGTTSGIEYYDGHGAWAPIMGVGYSRPLVQFSRGEYAGANNPEDDFAVMQTYGLPLRADDHGSGIGTATSLGAGTALTRSGVLSVRADRDFFSFTQQCAGPVHVDVMPAGPSPNVDVRVRLLSSTGSQIALASPPSAVVDADVASGLDAALDATVAAGTYFVEVDGVNQGDALSTGYSDYGSLGGYTVRIEPCATSGAADLIVTGLSWTPASPALGAGVRFSATIKNQGTQATPAGVVHGVQFLVGGVVRTFSDNSTASLAPGASRTLSANGGGSAGLWTATNGNHTVVANVDGGNRIAESNEANNTFSRPLAIGGGQVGPSAAAVVTGTLRSGTHTALASDDGTYYQVNSTTSGTRTASWYATLPNVPNTSTFLQATFRGSNSVSCAQVVWFWNFTTSTWTQVDTRTVGTSEVAITVSPAGTAAGFVSGSSGNGDVRVRVRCTHASANFFTRADQLLLTYR